MKRKLLVVEKRTVFGKKLKKLRKEGILPANIYGKDIKSEAVQIPYKTFEETYNEVGETGLIDVQLGQTTRPVLIHNVSKDHLRDLILHADFYQVNLKEKISTMIPLELTGEAKAVSENVGLLLQPVSEVEIEALPENLPEKIEVEVTHLAAVGDQILASDLKIPHGATLLSDGAQVVVKIDELVSEEAKEVAAEMAAEAEAKTEEGASEETNTEETAEKPTEEAPKTDETPKE